MSQLPPIPEPQELDADYNGAGRVVAIGFTADQMRAYAEQARADLLAEVEQLRSYADALNARCVADTPDAERYRWLRDNPLWSVGYRIKPRTGMTEWRMREEGEYWGYWWPTHEQAVDHATAAMKGQA